jgi:hypothetical protein
LGLDAGNLWVSDSSYPAKLIKIDLIIFTRPIPSEDIAYESVTEAYANPYYIDDIGGMKIDQSNHLAYLAVTPASGFGYVNTTLLKIDLTTGSVATPLDLDPILNANATAFDIDFTNGKAYISAPGYPAYLDKVTLDTFTLQAQIPLAITIDRSQAYAIDTQNEFLYVASNYVPPAIAKIDLTTFQLVAVLPLDNTLYNGMASGGIDIDDGYLYFNVQLKSIPGLPTGLLKIDIDPARTFELVEVLNLSPIYPGATLIDPVNNYAYIGTNTFPASVVRVDLDNTPGPSMVVLDQLDLSATFSDYELSFNSGVLDVANQFAYFGNWHPDSGSGRIFKIDINPANSLAKVDQLDFSATPAIRLFTTAVIDDVNQYAYFYARDPFVGVKVIKINIDPLNFSNVTTLAIADPGLSGDVVMAGIDTNLGFAFFTTNGMINKIDIDPSRTYSLLSQTSIPSKGTIITDPTKGFFYLITNQSVPVGVYKYGYTLAGYIQAYKVTVPAPIPEVDYFRFYSNVDSGSLRFALYDSSKVLLWESNEIINTVAGSWIDIPVSSGTPTSILNLPAGDYYLAFQTDTPEPVASQISGGEGFRYPTEFGSFPSGITGGTATTTEYSFYGAIVTAASLGGTISDVVPPADVTNLLVKADAAGKVTLTWNDPLDEDLKEIVITEIQTSGASETFTYPKDTQLVQFNNRIIGAKYEYVAESKNYDPGSGRSD